MVDRWAGRVYLERGTPVTVLVGYGPRTGDKAVTARVFTAGGKVPRFGPRNVTIRRVDGTVVVRLSPGDLRRLRIDVAGVAALIRGRRYVYTGEIELHEGIDEVLRDAGLAPFREVRLCARDRPDFLVALPDGPRLAIEAKIAGSAGDVARQLGRYAESDQVDELMLVTTIRRHLPGLPETMNGKPLSTVLLRGGF